MNFIRNQYIEINAIKIFHGFGKPALATLKQQTSLHLNAYSFCLKSSNEIIFCYS